MNIWDLGSSHLASTSNPWGWLWHPHYDDTRTHFPEKNKIKNIMLLINGTLIK